MLVPIRMGASTASPHKSLELRPIEINTSSCARIVQLAQTKAITQATTFLGQLLMSRNAKAWKLKRALLSLLQKEESCGVNAS